MLFITRSFLRAMVISLGEAASSGALAAAFQMRLRFWVEEYVPGPVDDLIAGFDSPWPRALHGDVLAIPGAVALLDWAVARKMPRALATSGFHGHADVSLAEAAWEGRFDAEVTGDKVQHDKPDPDLFLLAATSLGVPPE